MTIGALGECFAACLIASSCILDVEKRCKNWTAHKSSVNDQLVTMKEDGLDATCG